LLNGSTVHNKVIRGKLVSTLLEAGQSPEQVLETLYIRTLSRRPTADEIETLKQKVAEAPNPQQGLEDVFWAILNSREFVFNH
jgi:hypothetical protein